MRFTLPLLTLIVPILAGRLGSRTAPAPLMISLGIHELAHIAAARALGVKILEIRLMPFGGSARMENPYRLPPRKMIPVAAAGPLANLALLFIGAALAQWRALSPAVAADFVRINVVLFLFNLLPAFPLDGGRILYALLEAPLGERIALKTGIMTGRMLASALILAALAAGLRRGVWNLSFLLAAVFILASAQDERSARLASCSRRIGSLLERANQMQPVRLYQADADASVRSILPFLNRREPGWFILMKDNMPVGVTSSAQVLRALLKNRTPDAPLKEMQLFCILPERASGASIRTSLD